LGGGKKRVRWKKEPCPEKKELKGSTGNCLVKGARKVVLLHEHQAVLRREGREASTYVREGRKRVETSIVSGKVLVQDAFFDRGSSRK